jgi:hypothetical protein
MFDSYGQVASPSRIDSYLEVIGDHFSIEILRAGIVDAMRDAADFPPGPGNVFRACRAAVLRSLPDYVPTHDRGEAPPPPSLRLVPWKMPGEKIQ